jgi:short-subunit dehydrogenase
MIPKLALITGAASGLGFEFCRLLAADAYDLVMVDRDGEGLVQSARRLQESYGISIQTHIKDLGRNTAAGELNNELGEQDFDVLINNAGFGLYGHFIRTD